jgi:hypothetical protein
MERQLPITPTAGMGATLLGYTDRNAYTILRVDGKKLWATRDNVIRTDTNGMSDCQTYRYETVAYPDGDTLFTLRKDGRWHEGKRLSGNVLLIGHRDEYYDFSF